MLDLACTGPRGISGGVELHCVTMPVYSTAKALRRRGLLLVRYIASRLISIQITVRGRAVRAGMEIGELATMIREIDETHATKVVRDRVMRTGLAVPREVLPFETAQLYDLTPFGRQLADNLRKRAAAKKAKEKADGSGS